MFGIEIEDCARCGGKLQVIASIEGPEVIAKILAHLECAAPDQYPSELPLGARAPPSQAACVESVSKGPTGWWVTRPSRSEARECLRRR